MINLAWTYLIAAGLFEIGWPVGLKMAQTPGKTITGVILATVCMIISGYLLYLAQRHISMGTAYAGVDRHRRWGHLRARHFPLRRPGGGAEDLLGAAHCLRRRSVETGALTLLVLDLV